MVFSFFYALLLILISIYTQPHDRVIKIVVVDATTHKPLSGAYLTDSLNHVFTYSNDDGELYIVSDSSSNRSYFYIRYLGYKDYNLLIDTLQIYDTIYLSRTVYSLPIVYIGDYARELIIKAYNKSLSLGNIYIHAKYMDLQMLAINDTPAECIQSRGIAKLSSMTLKQQKVTFSRHADIHLFEEAFMKISPLDRYTMLNSINTFNENLKELLKDYRFEIIQTIPTSHSAVAKILCTPIHSSKHVLYFRYYYIDTSTLFIMRRVDSILFSTIHFSFKGFSINNSFYFKFMEEYIPYDSTYVPAFFSISIYGNAKGIDLRHYDTDSCLIFYRRVVYCIPGTHFNFDMIRNKVDDDSLNHYQIPDFPVPLSSYEQFFISYMEKHHAF